MKLMRVEINAQNPVRAMDFYHDVFGWEFEKADTMDALAYWYVKKGPPGLQFNIVKRDGETAGPPNAYVCTFEIDSVDTFGDKITSEGGRITPKLAIPGIGWVVVCQDTEGNTFAIQENDPDAKESNPLFKP